MGSHTLAQKSLRHGERENDNRTSAQRYVDILTEAGFKAVFGVEKNKDVLIGLLNVVLPAHRRVTNLAYSTTEVPGFTMASKSVRLDLRCTGEDGSRFIVEMQCDRQQNFFRRCVEYAAKVYDSGSERGDSQEYYIPPVYFVGLLNTGVPKFDRSDSAVWRDRYVSEYTFREKVSHEVVDETIFLIFVELDRFGKGLEECGSMADKWFYSLKHVGRMERLPEGLRVKVFERLFEACEIARFTPEEKLKYEHDMMTERDYTNILNTYRDEALAEGLAEGEVKGRLEGKAEGMAEGLAEGEARGKMEVARAMKAKGIEIALISELTGLSEEKIRQS